MKRLILLLIVASVMLIGAGMTTTTNAATNMPVYAVPGNGAGSWTTLLNSVAVRSQKHYYFNVLPSPHIHSFEFANIFGWDIIGVALEVDMTDTSLQWTIGQSPLVLFGTATATVMAGGEIGSTTNRIILSVWTDGASGGRVSFSGCADVAKQINPGQGETLPTSYAFLPPNADPNPNLGDFIPAENMNTTVLTFNQYERTQWSVWSAIKVNRYTKKGTYRDDFDITATGLD